MPEVFNITADVGNAGATYINPEWVTPEVLAWLQRLVTPRGWDKSVDVALVGFGQQGERNATNLGMATKDFPGAVSRVIIIEPNVQRREKLAQQPWLEGKVFWHTDLQAALDGEGIPAAVYHAETTTQRGPNLEVLMGTTIRHATGVPTVGVENSFGVTRRLRPDAAGLEKPPATRLPTVVRFYNWCNLFGVYTDQHIGEVPFHYIGLTLPHIIKQIEAADSVVERLEFFGMRGNSTQKLNGPRNLIRDHSGAHTDKWEFEFATALNIWRAINSSDDPQLDRVKARYSPAVILTPNGRIAYTREGELVEEGEIERRIWDIAEGSAYVDTWLGGKVPMHFRTYCSLVSTDLGWGDRIESALTDNVRTQLRQRGIDPLINRSDEFRAAKITVHTSGGEYTLGYRMIAPGKGNEAVKPFAWMVRPNGKSELLVSSSPTEFPPQQLIYIISVMDAAQGIRREPVITPNTAITIAHAYEAARITADRGEPHEWAYVDARRDMDLLKSLAPQSHWPADLVARTVAPVVVPQNGRKQG